MVSTSGISLPAGALSPPGGALTLASGLCYPGEPGLIWWGGRVCSGSLPRGRTFHSPTPVTWPRAARTLPGLLEHARGP